MVALVSLRAGVTFTADAAASFARVEADLGRRIDVNSTYRDYNKQLAMFQAWNRYVLSGRDPALHPGHSMALHPDASKHCLGLALDSDDWTKPGFIAFIARHGWIRTASNDPTERHHFEYQSTRDKHRARPVPAGGYGWQTLNPEEEEEEEDMPITDNDAQTIAKTQIILPSPWGQASIAETLAGTRARAESTYLMVSALATAVSTLAGAQGIPADELATLISTEVKAKLASDFEAVKNIVQGSADSLTDDEVDAFAAAVADEQDRRARARYAQVDASVTAR